MKIAILGTAYPYRGGIAAFNERLAKELIAEGHQLSIYTFKLQYLISFSLAKHSFHPIKNLKTLT